MRLISSHELQFSSFENNIIVFDPSSGQTHCLDSEANNLISYIHSNKNISEQALLQHFSQGCTIEEKSVLLPYIQDMIKNLINLDLIQAHACN